MSDEEKRGFANRPPVAPSDSIRSGYAPARRRKKRSSLLSSKNVGGSSSDTEAMRKRGIGGGAGMHPPSSAAFGGGDAGGGGAGFDVDNLHYQEGEGESSSSTSAARGGRRRHSIDFSSLVAIEDVAEEEDGNARLLKATVDVPLGTSGSSRQYHHQQQQQQQQSSVLPSHWPKATATSSLTATKIPTKTGAKQHPEEHKYRSQPPTSQQYHPPHQLQHRSSMGATSTIMAEDAASLEDDFELKTVDMETGSIRSRPKSLLMRTTDDYATEGPGGTTTTTHAHQMSGLAAGSGGGGLAGGTARHHRNYRDDDDDNNSEDERSVATLSSVNTLLNMMQMALDEDWWKDRAQAWEQSRAEPVKAALQTEEEKAAAAAAASSSSSSSLLAANIATAESNSGSSNRLKKRLSSKNGKNGGNQKKRRTCYQWCSGSTTDPTNKNGKHNAGLWGGLSRGTKIVSVGFMLLMIVGTVILATTDMADSIMTNLKSSLTLSTNKLMQGSVEGKNVMVQVFTDSTGAGGAGGVGGGVGIRGETASPYRDEGGD